MSFDKFHFTLITKGIEFKEETQKQSSSHCHYQMYMHTTCKRDEKYDDEHVINAE